MSNTFLISDTHFGHLGVTKFLREDGSPLRPWDDVLEMDEAMIDNWNRVVSDKDRVYHLGDVVINRKALVVLNRLKGRKKLVKGNHDIFKLTDYLPYFDDIQAYAKLDTFMCSHIPMHPNSIGRWQSGNIHGHLHANVVLDGEGFPDKRYINVSVEQINYTPIDFEEIRERYKI